MCRLDKSAYGLVDAPYLWYKTLCDELKALGMQPSPFDPCLYILRPDTQNFRVHWECMWMMEFMVKVTIFMLKQPSWRKYPFVSKKSRAFTFTGIEMYQYPNKRIELSHTKVRQQHPTHINQARSEGPRVSGCRRRTSSSSWFSGVHFST